MNYSIELKHNYGYKWYMSNDVYVKGYVIDRNESLLQGEDLLNYFNSFDSIDTFIDNCSDANGNFVVVAVRDGKVYLAADSTRTFPLFYYFQEERLIVSDDAYYLRDTFNVGADLKSIDEFLFTSYVTGNATLLSGVNQIVAGEILVIDGIDVERNSYFDYCVNKNEIVSNASGKQLNQLLIDAMTRVVRSVKESTIVLPLSGGYDSRLIAVLLKELNYDNVVCFTYGDIENVEVQISMQVAHTLGFKWIFVDYTEMSFEKDFFESSEFVKYYKFANNMSSVFLLQDYFAIRHLKRNNLIPDDSVIIPGHSGDFNVGNHLFPWDKLIQGNTICSKEIFKRHYILDQKIASDQLFDKVTHSIPNEGTGYSRIENFNLKERQAKLIINANRVYEFFGYQHRMLFWDKDLVEFFRVLKFSDKLNSKLYFEAIIDGYFIPNDVHIVPPDKKGSRWMRNLKQLIPYRLAVLIRKRAHRNLQIDTTRSYFRVFTPIIKEFNLKSHICTGISTKWLLRKEFGIKVNDI